MKTKVAVFASGRGSNFDSILEATRAGRLDAEIVALVCDQPEAPVIAKARAAGVPTLVIPGMKPREAHEETVLRALEPYQPRFAVLAGYMRILTAKFLDAFRSERGHSRVVNIHPSLLPAFKGVDAYAQAFAYGAKVAGATVHLVELGVDEGPICAQESFSIADCADAESVRTRGLGVEHRLYPETLDWILTEKFAIESTAGGRQRVRPR